MASPSGSYPFRRRLLAALFVSVFGAGLTRGADLGNRDDAPLHAVQFLDAREGWAVGDEGLAWHTADGGAHWEARPTGVRASLRSLHFRGPLVGWVVGRQEQPYGAGSTGVLLFTNDGGKSWRHAAMNAFPGLNRVAFADARRGLVAGDGSDAYPSGVFTTADGGRSWKPVPGPRATAWWAADYGDGSEGVLAGAWGRTATFRAGLLADADAETQGRDVRALWSAEGRTVAVGVGGLVLLRAAADERWTPVDLKLSSSTRAEWDFHAVHGRGDELWAAGRPGSAVLHSADAGRNWEVQRTGQAAPLNGIYFLDARRGWAVGELGTVLATEDGGKSWKVQKQGGQRAAALFLQARPAEAPFDTVAQLGGQAGYLVCATGVTSPDPASAISARCTAGTRLSAAVRLAGGAAGEVVTGFALPEHLATAAEADLLRSWDRLHADRAGEELVRRMVLALRTWQPDVVVTDAAEEKSAPGAVAAVVGRAVREAFSRSADPKAFPEQIETLGLAPWQAIKLYALCAGRKGAQVVLDSGDVVSRLEATARDFAAPAAALLSDTPDTLPRMRCYRLLEGRVAGAAEQADLLDGVLPAPGVNGRKVMGWVAEADPVLVRAVRERGRLQALAENPAGELNDPARLLAALGPVTAKLPESQAAPAVFSVARQFARRGRWSLAREAYLLLVDRYPKHPLAAEAYRWLIRYSGSGEARRRHELTQLLVQGEVAYTGTAEEQSIPGGADGKPAAKIKGRVEPVGQGQVALLTDPQEARKWARECLGYGPKLTAMGAFFGADPSVQFCLQAAHRDLGEFQAAHEWYTRFQADHPAGVWHDAAAAELWLANRSGPPPKPVLNCRQTLAAPFLDGKLDDACWQGNAPSALRSAAGDTAAEYPTEVRLAYDAQYLYVAVSCRHPAGQAVAPVKGRVRDADLSGFDRVSLLLDIDRDYSTYYRLEVDQRSCVREDCWGDRTWDPTWFVAVKSEATGWCVEAAVPLIELTGEPITFGRAWACNVVRTLPGRGVQAFSLPADVEPRPEGMGLLLFGKGAEAKDGKGKPEAPGAGGR